MDGVEASIFQNMYSIALEPLKWLCLNLRSVLCGQCLVLLIYWAFISSAVAKTELE